MYYACQDGTKVEEDEVDEIFDEVEKVLDKIKAETENMKNEEDRSVGEMMETYFNEYLNELQNEKNLSNERVETIKAIFKARSREEQVQNACEDLNKFSAIGWNEYTECEGDDQTNLKFGYGQLIEHLASKIPAEKILLDHIVTKIQWPSDSSKPGFQNHVVIVTTYNPHDNTESHYYGYQCLCTMSLGYLKEKHQELFEPELPENKVRAIENLGFGLVNKLFIVFQNPVFEV